MNGQEQAEANKVREQSSLYKYYSYQGKDLHPHSQYIQAWMKRVQIGWDKWPLVQFVISISVDYTTQLKSGYHLVLTVTIPVFNAVHNMGLSLFPKHVLSFLFLIYTKLLERCFCFLLLLFFFLKLFSKMARISWF